MTTKHQPGGKHVPGAIAILLAGSNYDPVDNGKRVRLIRLVPFGSSAMLTYQGVPQGDLFNTRVSERIWEVVAVDSHLHLTRLLPVCVDNNCYYQHYLLIIGDESLVKDEPTVEEQHAADKAWLEVSKELSKV